MKNNRSLYLCSFINKRLVFLILIFFFYSYSILGVGPNALPSTPQAQEGTVNVSQPAASHLLVNQMTPKAIVASRTFDIGSKAHVQIQQPSSDAAMLWRVTGSKMSEIMGKLTANGRLFLVNPNGVVMGKTAVVDVGTLVTSTLDISNEDFKAGHYRFSSPEGIKAGHIHITEGASISVREGGMAVFVAPSMENAGLIQGRMARVALAAGEAVTVDFYGDKLINLAVATKPVSSTPKNHKGEKVKNLINNTGKIQAEGGNVLFTVQAARKVVDDVINNDGIVTVKSVRQEGGTIILDGGSQGTVQARGTLDASSQKSFGGRVGIYGKHTVTSGKIIADGKKEGGEILIGGNFQGKSASAMTQVGGKIPYYKGTGQKLIASRNAKSTHVTSTGNLSAASKEGIGGKIIVWSDKKTHFAGFLNVKGERGGFVEVSAKEASTNREFHFQPHNAGFLEGRIEPGTLLLDPKNITVESIMIRRQDDVSLQDIQNLSNSLWRQEESIRVGIGDLQRYGGNIVLLATNNIEIKDDIQLRVGFIAQAEHDLRVSGNLRSINDVSLLAHNDMFIEGEVAFRDGSFKAARNLNVSSSLQSTGDVSLNAGNDLIIDKKHVVNGSFKAKAVGNISTTKDCVIRSNQNDIGLEADGDLSMIGRLVAINGVVSLKGTNVTLLKENIAFDDKGKIEATQAKITYKGEKPKFAYNRINPLNSLIEFEKIDLGGNILEQSILIPGAEETMPIQQAVQQIQLLQYPLQWQQRQLQKLQQIQQQLPQQAPQLQLQQQVPQQLPQQAHQVPQLQPEPRAEAEARAAEERRVAEAAEREQRAIEEQRREVEEQRREVEEQERREADERRLAQERERRLAQERERRLAQERERRLAEERERRLAEERERQIAEERAIEERRREVEERAIEERRREVEERERREADERRLAEERERQIAEERAIEERRREVEERERREADERRLAQERERRLAEERERQIAEERAIEERRREVEEQERREADERRLAEERERQIAEERAIEERERQIAEERAIEERRREAEERERHLAEERERQIAEERVVEERRLAEERERREADERRLAQEQREPEERAVEEQPLVPEWEQREAEAWTIEEQAQRETGARAVEEKWITGRVDAEARAQQPYQLLQREFQREQPQSEIWLGDFLPGVSLTDSYKDLITIIEQKVFSPLYEIRDEEKFSLALNNQLSVSKKNWPRKKNVAHKLSR